MPKINNQTKFDKRISNVLLNLNSLCDLSHLNIVRNELNRTLDLILTDIDNDKFEVMKCEDPLVSEDCHHPALELNVDLSPVKCLFEKKMPKVNFYKADCRTLNEQLCNVEWEIELSGLDVNEGVNRFYEILDSYIESIPKVHYLTRDFPVYLSPLVNRRMRRKK